MTGADAPDRATTSSPSVVPTTSATAPAGAATPDAVDDLMEAAGASTQRPRGHRPPVKVRTHTCAAD